MNIKEKKLGVFFTILVFSRAIMGGDISTIDISYNILKDELTTPYQTIFFTLPPIEAESLEGIDRAIEEYTRLMQGI